MALDGDDIPPSVHPPSYRHVELLWTGELGGELLLLRRALAPHLHISCLLSWGVVAAAADEKGSNGFDDSHHDRSFRLSR